VLKVYSSLWGKGGCIQLNTSDYQLLLTAESMHSSLAFAGSYCAVSQILGVFPKVKISDQDPSMDRNFRMLRQINSTIPHDVQGVKENKKHLPSQCSFKEKKDTKSTKTFLGDFRFSSWFLEPDPCEKRDMIVFWIAS